MNEFSQSFPRAISVDQGFVRRVYNWMAAGLGITALVASYILRDAEILYSLLSHQYLLFGMMIGEIVLVFWLSARVHKMSVSQATLIFFSYAALNGITLTPMLVLYTRASIVSTFLITGGTFAVTSFYGYVTKKDLTSLGGFAMMGLIGLIIASVVNIFLQSPGLYWLISVIGVGVMVILTAYDTQKIKELSQGFLGDEEVTARAAIMGALRLYLDFVLMFIYLLRFMGNRR